MKNNYTTEIYKDKESAIRRIEELHKQGIRFVAWEDVLKEEYCLTIESEVEE